MGKSKLAQTRKPSRFWNNAGKPFASGLNQSEEGSFLIGLRARQTIRVTKSHSTSFLRQGGLDRGNKSEETINNARFGFSGSARRAGEMVITPAEKRAARH